MAFQYKMVKVGLGVLLLAQAASAFAPQAALRPLGFGHKSCSVLPTSSKFGVKAATGRASMVHSLRMVATGDNKVDGERKPVNQKATKHDLATGRDPARVKVFDTTLRD